MLLPHPDIVSGAEQLVEVSCEQLMRTLNATDASFMQALTVSIEVTEPSHMMFPDQGTVTRMGIITSLGRSAGLILEQPRFDRTPTYEGPGGQYDPVNYDEHGNLIVWRRGDLFFLRNEDFSYAYEVKSLQRIAPGNTVVSTEPSYRLSKFVASDQKGSVLFARVILAMGRGFAEHLNAIKTAKSLPSGLIEVVADGSYGSQLPGTWTITVDPAARHMVRAASFVVSGHDAPGLLVEVSGTQGDASGAFPLQGQVTYRFGEDRFVLTTIVKFNAPEREGQQRVVDRAWEKVQGELPAGAEIFDYRGLELRRYTIGEESPESE
jgi:hypothetical protein